MTNANRTLDERQDATAVSRCLSCVATGHDCFSCGNSFCIGDLRVSVEGAPSGERAHFFCAVLDQRPRRALAVELMWPGPAALSPRAAGAFETGSAVVEEITEVLGSLSDLGDMRATMARLLVSGYLMNGGLEPAYPTTHVGIPDEKLETCDFCSGEPVAGTVGPLSFWHFVTGGPGEVPIHYQGPWAYCEGCRPFVEARNHLTLAKRAMSSREPAEKDPERRKRHFEGLYETVLKESA